LERRNEIEAENSNVKNKNLKSLDQELFLSAGGKGKEEQSPIKNHISGRNETKT